MEDTEAFFRRTNQLSGSDLQVQTIARVLEQREEEFLERAAAQKDLGDKGNSFSLGYAQGLLDAADSFRGVRHTWVENY